MTDVEEGEQNFRLWVHPIDSKVAPRKDPGMTANSGLKRPSMDLFAVDVDEVNVAAVKRGDERVTTECSVAVQPCHARLSSKNRVLFHGCLCFDVKKGTLWVSWVEILEGLLTISSVEPRWN
jgi:hypothetical protein